MEISRERCAVHEAGHAVVAYHLGIGMELSLEQFHTKSGLGLGSAVRRSFKYRAFEMLPSGALRSVTPAEAARRTRLAELAVSYGGAIAEKLMFPKLTDEEMKLWFSGDNNRIGCLLRELGVTDSGESQKLIKKAWSRARRILTQRMGAIAAVASALLERGMLTAEEVSSAIQEERRAARRWKAITRSWGTLEVNDLRVSPETR